MEVVSKISELDGDDAIANSNFNQNQGKLTGFFTMVTGSEVHFYTYDYAHTICAFRWRRRVAPCIEADGEGNHFLQTHYSLAMAIYTMLWTNGTGRNSVTFPFTSLQKMCSPITALIWATAKRGIEAMGSEQNLEANGSLPGPDRGDTKVESTTICKECIIPHDAWMNSHIFD